MRLLVRSGRALYLQLIDAIRLDIETGIYKAGESLPGERQLMQIYGVSRPTVRHSVGELAREGVLIRQHGKGTFVNPRIAERRPVLELYGLLEELKMWGHETEVRFIGSGVQVVSADIARQLEISGSEKIFHYKRLILADGRPLLFTTTHVSQSVKRLFEYNRIDITQDVVYEKLERSGYKITEATQDMWVGSPTEEEARHLDYDIEKNVFILFRTTYIGEGKPIMASRAVYRPEYTLRLRLRRGRHSASGA